MRRISRPPADETDEGPSNGQRKKRRVLEDTTDVAPRNFWDEGVSATPSIQPLKQRVVNLEHTRAADFERVRMSEGRGAERVPGVEGRVSGLEAWRRGVVEEMAS